MTCITLRRRALTDPLAPGPGASDHLAACRPCRDFYAALCRREARLYRALARPLPPSLIEHAGIYSLEINLLDTNSPSA